MATTPPITSRLKHKIKIQLWTESIDAAGAPTGSWSDFITRFASVVPLNGSEYFASQQLTVDINVRIRLRYDKKAATITSKHRVLWGSRTFDIKTIINAKEHNREIVLMCEESP